uniref:Protein kinase domain-containing protein n=1 Tax=Amphimedon queenslandica TaxID=400682 RepID=A0A1X7T1N5_AMPQE
MDVYSYSVLLLEMTITRPPATTLSERDKQVQTASTAWPAMKSIIEDGIAVDPRAHPVIIIIIDKLKNIIVSPRDFPKRPNRPTN